MTHAAEMEGVRKRYGDTDALDGLNLVVKEGTIHGLLGPNGAGKTTAVRVLSTLLRFDAGTARVAGLDVVRQAADVRSHIGLTGQYAAVDEILSGRQNLVMFARLFSFGARDARRRADELLERFGLMDAADNSAGQYSGGMRRRLDLAASMIRTPYILFLDEPTTGLDPRGRNEVWDAVRGLVAEGCTVLLTTQYMEEADQLADQVSVIDAGHIVAEGTPNELKTTVGGDHLDVVVHDVSDLELVTSIAARLAAPDVTPEIDADRRMVSVAVTDRMLALSEAMRAMQGAGVSVEDLGVRRPTLDEAFLMLTGRRPAEHEEVPA